jgi:hypothetical protein
MKAESGPAREGDCHHTVHWPHIACEDAPAQRGLLHSPASLPFGTSCLPDVQEASTVEHDRVHWKKRQKQIERLKARHGADRSLIREFPDLKVEQRTAPCSNGMRGTTARRPRPAGMKQFPVGHSHKQGLELITPGTDLQWMGGKKT